MTDAPRGLILNFATLAPDREDEFNRWYDEEHLPAVLCRFPQIASARRYRATDGEQPQYLVLYEYDVSTEAELNAAASGENPLRKELWEMYEAAIGQFASRTRRCFWRIYPP
jgi:hypothetical protein